MSDFSHLPGYVDVAHAVRAFADAASRLSEVWEAVPDEATQLRLVRAYPIGGENQDWPDFQEIVGSAQEFASAYAENRNYGKPEYRPTDEYLICRSPRWDKQGIAQYAWCVIQYFAVYSGRQIGVQGRQISPDYPTEAEAEAVLASIRQTNE